MKEIFGRSRDCIYTTKGTLISPAKVFVMMWGADGVKQWQFVQKTKDHYHLKLNIDKKVDEDLLKNKFLSVLGEGAVIDVEYVDEIPVLSSNKRRAVICEWKKS